jgi:hypothetical protein
MLKQFLLTAGLAAALFAQAPPSPTPFNGTLVSSSNDSVTIKDKEGKTVVVQMAPGWTVSKNRKGDAAAVKAGDFVATANTIVDASTGKATELRVLEPGYRPENGTHGIVGSPNMMTHGTVASAKKTGDDVELTVISPDGSRRIIVPAGVGVTVSDLLDRTALKPGVGVSGVTRKGDDGVYRAGRVTVAN